MKISIGLIRLSGVLCAGFLAACQDEATTRQAEPLNVRVETVRSVEHSQTVTLTGEVVAEVETNLSFRVSGQIVERLADIGANVKVGQLLARLDPREQQADVEASEATVRAAEAQVRQANATLDRQTSLMAQGFTTRRDFDQASTAARTAENALDAARAQLETAQDALSYTQLRAQADGVVTTRTAEAGQVAQAAQTMFTIAHDGPRDAVFDVYESLFFMRPADANIRVALVSDPSVVTTGRIRDISPTIDTAKGTVQVKIALKETPAAMTLGSSVTGFARFVPDRVTDLPWTALSSSEGKPAVWVVDPADGTALLKPVTVSSYETGRVLIASGLKEGETVIVEGGKLLRPGQAVSILEEAAQ